MAKSTTQIEREIRLELLKLGMYARGLWHEMRHLIETESDRPGHLQRNGRPLSDAQLAQAAGCPSDAVARLLQELVDVGLVERVGACWVAGRLASIAEGRLKRRELTREWRAGGGEAKAVRRREKPREKQDRGGAVSRDTHRDRSVTAAQPDGPPPPPPGSPPASPLLPPPPPPPVTREPAGGEDGGAAMPDGVRMLPVGSRPRPGATPGLVPGEPSTRRGVTIPEPLRTPEFLAAWSDWELHLRQKRVSTTRKADEQQLAKCLEWGANESVVALRHSTAGNYQGLFLPPPERRGGGGNGARDRPAAPAACSDFDRRMAAKLGLAGPETPT
ncbi:MAG TPA: helix-turn-helix domain-containing protein [Humisphaera sp.]